MRRPLLLLLLLVVVGAAGYLLFWPVRLDPVAWEPPTAPAVVLNDRLAGLRILSAALAGPESVAVDAQGRMYTGTEDGQIVRVSPDGRPTTIASTGGRPLGVALDAAGNLIVADAEKGLLSVDPRGRVTVLADRFEGERFRFTDDVAIGKDGTIYFSDASQRFGYDDRGAQADILEHRATGRVFAYHPQTQAVTQILSDLHFANGLALSPDGDALLVCETGRYRVLRHWLHGPKQGTTEPFAENLPGFPDNITTSPRGVYWVALYSPRVPIVDRLARRPFWRKVAWRLPGWLRPRPIRKAFVLGLDESGGVAHDLQADGPNVYAPVTSAIEHDGALYLGSVERHGIAVLRAP